MAKVMARSGGRELVAKATARLVSLKRRDFCKSTGCPSRGPCRFSDTSRAVTLVTSSLVIAAFAFPASAQTPRTLTITRDLKIDATTQDFTAIYAIAIGRDGSMNVWQTKDNKILFFDAKGASIGSLGRKGEGPGEFNYLSTVHGWIGDTLWIAEANRLTLISPQHKFMRNVPSPRAIKAGASDTASRLGVSAELRAMLPGGQLVWTIGFSRGAPRPTWAPSDGSRAAVVATGASAVFQKAVGWFPSGTAEPCEVLVMATTMEAHIAIPYCAQPVGTWSDNGSSFGVVTQDNPTGAKATYRATVVRTTGDTIFARNYTANTNAISRRLADSTVGMRLDPRNNYPPEVYAAYRAMKIPANHAPVKRIEIGHDGTVWIELKTGEPEHTWQVLTAKGDPIGQVVLPRNIELKVVSRSEVWGVEKDQDDLESVVRYKVGP